MDKRRVAPVISFMLCMLSWELTAAMFGTRWLFGPGWFGPDKEWVRIWRERGLVRLPCVLWTAPDVEILHKGLQEQMTVAQAFAVVLLSIAAGVFGTWLFCG